MRENFLTIFFSKLINTVQAFITGANKNPDDIYFVLLGYPNNRKCPQCGFQMYYRVITAEEIRSLPFWDLKKEFACFNPNCSLCGKPHVYHYMPDELGRYDNPEPTWHGAFAYRVEDKHIHLPGEKIQLIKELGRVEYVQVEKKKRPKQKVKKRKGTKLWPKMRKRKPRP